MNPKLLDHAREFIYLQARLLERTLFAALYEGGSKEAVLRALRAYQNPDGGFGNALEPDLRSPASQPLAVERAFMVLDMMETFDDPMAGRACDWLEQQSTSEGGVAFALPGLEGYPHSPWMRADNTAAQLNPTASLCAFLLKHQVQHAWVQQASDYCWRTIPHIETDAYHDIMPVLEFLTYTPENRGEAARQMERFRDTVVNSNLVTLDPKAQGYVKFPLDWAPTPNSTLHSIFSPEIMDQHLKNLVGQQQADGSWPINWPPLSPAAEIEWRGVRVIEYLNILKAYGVLQAG